MVLQLELSLDIILDRRTKMHATSSSLEDLVDFFSTPGLGNDYSSIGISAGAGTGAGASAGVGAGAGAGGTAERSFYPLHSQGSQSSTLTTASQIATPSVVPGDSQSHYQGALSQSPYPSVRAGRADAVPRYSLLTATSSQLSLQPSQRAQQPHAHAYNDGEDDNDDEDGCSSH